MPRSARTLVADERKCSPPVAKHNAETCRHRPTMAAPRGRVPPGGVNRLPCRRDRVSVRDGEGPSREALREATKRLTERIHMMALDQSALLELLDVIRRWR